MLFKNVLELLFRAKGPGSKCIEDICLKLNDSPGNFMYYKLTKDIDIRNLEIGLYFLKVNYNQTPITKKLIKL